MALEMVGLLGTIKWVMKLKELNIRMARRSNEEFMLTIFTYLLYNVNDWRLFIAPNSKDEL